MTQQEGVRKRGGLQGPYGGVESRGVTLLSRALSLLSSTLTVQALSPSPPLFTP